MSVLENLKEKKTLYKEGKNHSKSYNSVILLLTFLYIFQVFSLAIYVKFLHMMENSCSSQVATQPSKRKEFIPSMIKLFFKINESRNKKEERERARGGRGGGRILKSKLMGCKMVLGQWPMKEEGEEVSLYPADVDTAAVFPLVTVLQFRI